MFALSGVFGPLVQLLVGLGLLSSLLLVTCLELLA